MTAPTREESLTASRELFEQAQADLAAELAVARRRQADALAMMSVLAGESLLAVRAAQANLAATVRA